MSAGDSPSADWVPGRITETGKRNEPYQLDNCLSDSQKMTNNVKEQQIWYIRKYSKDQIIYQVCTYNNNFIYTLESEVKLRSVVFTITGSDAIQWINKYSMSHFAKWYTDNKYSSYLIGLRCSVINTAIRLVVR